MVVNLSYEESRSRERMQQQQVQIDKIENILIVIERCEHLLATCAK